MKKEKTKIPTHIHLFERIDLVPSWKQKLYPDKYKPYKVFQCRKPACNSRIPLNQALGKLCECWICHEPMIIDKETIKKAKPRCNDCIQRKPKPNIDKLSELLKDI